MLRWASRPMDLTGLALVAASMLASVAWSAAPTSTVELSAIDPTVILTLAITTPGACNCAGSEADRRLRR